jgi:predicted outer membrane protein
MTFGPGDDMKLTPAFWLFIGSLGLAPRLAAQTPGDKSLSEAGLYSLYVKRHAMTVEFANLGLAHAVDGDVRSSAENLVRTHREAQEKLEKSATERHLTLAPPAHDTTTALLDQARTALEGKTGRAFDSTWVNLGSSWLTTLILDNNRVVKAQIAPELQPVAQAHTTWLFHQSADLGKVRKNFQ